MTTNTPFRLMKPFLLLGLLWLPWFLTPALAEEPPRPSVVIIFTDDQGCGFDDCRGSLAWTGGGGSVQLWDDTTCLGESDDMGCLSRAFTDKAIDFVKAHRDEPFLPYVDHLMMHTAIDASPGGLGNISGQQRAAARNMPRMPPSRHRNRRAREVRRRMWI